jgi:hypothetical protein
MDSVIGQREPLFTRLYLVEDEMGGHWSTEPQRQKSMLIYLSRYVWFVHLRIRIRFLGNLLPRIGKIFSRSAEAPIPVEAFALGERFLAWPQVCIQDMQQQLDKNCWVDDFDRRVWIQAWLEGARWMRSMLGNEPLR